MGNGMINVLVRSDPSHVRHRLQQPQPQCPRRAAHGVRGFGELGRRLVLPVSSDDACPAIPLRLGLARHRAAHPLRQRDVPDFHPVHAEPHSSVGV